MSFSKYTFQNFLFVHRICVYLVPLSRFHTIIPLDRIKFKIIICSLFQRPERGSDAPTEKHETPNSKSLKKKTQVGAVFVYVLRSAFDERVKKYTSTHGTVR